MTTHPFYSRRMHRLLVSQSINSTYEEYLNMQHWWWDSQISNDGGVLNDKIMRHMYSYCLEKSNKLWIDKYHHSKNEFKFQIEQKNDLKQNEIVNENSLNENRCMNQYTLTVINPAMQNGLCNIRILQQLQILSLSLIHVHCDNNQNNNETNCMIETKNVERFQLLLQFNDNTTTQWNQMKTITINNQIIDLLIQNHKNSIDICINNEKYIQICEKSLNLLEEKTLINYGPVRLVYSRPFIIVYGTPNDPLLRLAMKDYAIYLANSHMSAHETYVRVISDTDYWASKMYLETIISNIIMIGGPMINKLMKRICQNHTSTSNLNDIKPLNCNLPVKFQSNFNDIDEIKSTIYEINEHIFDSNKESIVFTFPIVRNIQNNNKNEEDSLMGVCIHSTSMTGYIDLTRVAWPVVPPMVRSPFTNYIPDYIVINSLIWSHGFGGVLLAGFWNTKWKYDSKQSYTKNN